MSKEKFYITTAIAYASQKPHIGNTYEIILTDCIARYKKMRGYDVCFCTGTDEHGQKIENHAKEKGVTPQEYVDGVSSEIRRIWDAVGAEYDIFIRTTDKHHEKAVAAMFEKFYEQGDIYKSEYEGWYCVPCESFITDSQLVDGKCPECGRPVSKTTEEAYNFRMSKYADRLMEHIEKNPDFIMPESRKKEMVNNFLKPGLQDLCVSRSSFKWGIPVRFDEKHVIYVWMDALSNYITALGYDPEGESGENFNKYWPADVHVIGKDILRFHTIYWPIFLMALGLELPKQVFGHPWLLFGEDKMSKSKGNVIYADDLVRHFGKDGTRYYVLAETPYANDGSITYENIIKRYNSDLANNLGNLVKRTLAMTGKYFGGAVPAPGEETELDRELKETFEKSRELYYASMDKFMTADATDAVFTLLRRANKYIDETTPWILAKSEEGTERLKTVIYNLLESIRCAAVMLYPMIPDTALDILKQIGTEKTDMESLDKFGALEAGILTSEGDALFSRIDEAKKLEEIASEKADKEKAEQKAEKPEELPKVNIDQFFDIELRTAQIVECEPVPKAKKLLKLIVDLGYEKRQVVSGIAKFYKPEDLIGKKVVLVANLNPAKLCGVESNGMILASGEEDIKVVFLDPETPLGERVR